MHDVRSNYSKIKDELWVICKICPMQTKRTILVKLKLIYLYILTEPIFSVQATSMIYCKAELRLGNTHLSSKLIITNNNVYTYQPLRMSRKQRKVNFKLRSEFKVFLLLDKSPY